MPFIFLSSELVPVLLAILTSSIISLRLANATLDSVANIINSLNVEDISAINDLTLVGSSSSVITILFNMPFTLFFSSAHPSAHGIIVSSINSSAFSKSTASLFSLDSIDSSFFFLLLDFFLVLGFSSGMSFDSDLSSADSSGLDSSFNSSSNTSVACSFISSSTFSVVSSVVEDSDFSGIFSIFSSTSVSFISSTFSSSNFDFSSNLTSLIGFTGFKGLGVFTFFIKLAIIYLLSLFYV